MRCFSRSLGFCAKAGVLCVFVLSAGSGTRADDGALLFRPPDAAALRALERLSAASAEPVDARWEVTTGKLRSLEGRFPLRDLAPGAEGGDSRLADACLRLLRKEPELFGWSEAIELRLDSTRDGIGTKHLRFKTFVAGVPVEESEVAFHIDVSAPDSPSIRFITSRLQPEAAVVADGGVLAPRLSGPEAIQVAEAAVSPRRALRDASVARIEVAPSPPPVRLAYAVEVRSLEPHGLFIVRVDAASGEVLSSGDVLRYAPAAAKDGKGKVFITSPPVFLRDPSLRDQDDSAAAVPSAAYSEVTLPALDGSGLLIGPYVSTEKTPHAVRRVRLDFSFTRDDDGFEEVMVYYHIDSLQRFIQSLGFTNACNRQVHVYADAEPPGIPYTDAQAYYQPNLDNPGFGEMAFGSGGTDLAEDPEVICHEYGHAVEDSQVPGFGSNTAPLETFALGEGWADFLSATYLSAFTGGYGDLCLGEWAASSDDPNPGQESPGCIRRMDSPKHYPEDLVGEPHADGEMWSASLWKIFQSLGREAALTLVLQSNFFLTTEATFEDAAQAVLRADRDMHGGVHHDLIARIFEERGLLLAPLSLSWFYVRKHAPPARVPAVGSLFSKLRLDRPGTIHSGAGGVEVYVNLAYPSPGSLDVVLRSPTGTPVFLNRADSRFLPARPVIYGQTAPPSDPLEALEGEPISGVWSLEIVNGTQTPASLLEWGLRFQGFVRGDTNGDGKIDISDVITLLGFMFRRGEMSCLKSGDADDSGALNVTDAIDLILHLFGSGSPPAAPFPDPGEDLTPDDLSCGG